MPVVLDRIAVEDIEALWPRVEPYIRAGTEAVTTETTAAYIKAEALADRRIIWVALDMDDPDPVLGAASMGIRDTNHGPVFFVDAIGGREMDRWLPQCLAELEDRARRAGMRSGEFEGRKGWARVLARHGYRVVRVVVEKVL